jgi:hypothetical protein
MEHLKLIKGGHDKSKVNYEHKALPYGRLIDCFLVALNHFFNDTIGLSIICPILIDAKIFNICDAHTACFSSSRIFEPKDLKAVETLVYVSSVLNHG